VENRIKTIFSQLGTPMRANFGETIGRNNGSTSVLKVSDGKCQLLENRD
jgi:hypothetical protein